jgi:hypothetical protein
VALLEILVAASVSIQSVRLARIARDYDLEVIDSGQFVNGLWMGTILLVLGLVPGLLDRIIQGLIDAAAAAQFRFPLPMRARFLANQAAPLAFPHRRWLAGAGVALIALTVFAYIAH